MHISTQTISNKFKLAIVITAAVSLTLLVVKSAHAQEITPTAGTYSYGSTSEFSPYVTLAASTTLAPTGDSQTAGYIVAISLLVVSTGIIVHAVRKNKALILNQYYLMFRLRLITIILASIILSLAMVNIARAATFTVDSIDDGGNTGGPGVCDNGGGKCTLRAAIEAANATAGADVIDFNIPGAGVQTITPASALPNITEQVTIDGTTQPGASCGTLVPATLPGSSTPHTLLIEIDGTNAGSGDGINFVDSGSSNSIVRGLVINRFSTGAGVTIQDSSSIPDNVTVECNYLGTGTDGASSLLNTIGVYLSTASNAHITNNLLSGNVGGIVANTAGDSVFSGNLIGTSVTGNSAIANTIVGIYLYASSGISMNHNVISGNTDNGINLDTANTAISFTGNYIGVGLAGSALGNGMNGIKVYSSDNTTIGGSGANQGNVISANGGDGVHMYSDCNGGPSQTIGSITTGNYIGTNASGDVQAGYGNQKAGIEVNEYYGGCVSVYNHQIGGSLSGQANIIAGNSAQGVLIHQSGGQDVFSVTTIGNSIYGNGQFGIDLASDSDSNTGVADTDLGPNPLNSYLMAYPTGGYANYYLNRPTINSTNFSGNQLTVNYSYQAPGVEDNLPSISSGDVVGYRLDFYLNENSQDGAYAGYNQGKTHLGSFIVNGSETNATHTFTSPVTLNNNMSISSTVTVLWTTTPSGGRQGTAPPYTNPK